MPEINHVCPMPNCEFITPAVWPPNEAKEAELRTHINTHDPVELFAEITRLRGALKQAERLASQVRHLLAELEV